MLEAGANQGFQVIHLEVCGDVPLQALPGITRTLDQFDGVGHEVYRNYLKRGALEFVRFGRNPGGGSFRTQRLGLIGKGTNFSRAESTAARDRLQPLRLALNNFLLSG